MSQRMVMITLPEKEGLRAVDMLLSFSWISNLDVSRATRCVVCKSRTEIPTPSTVGRSLRRDRYSEDDKVEEKLFQVVKIQFKVRATHLGATVKALKAEGIGSVTGTVDVTDVRVSTEALPKQPKERKQFCRSLTDRLSTLELHDTIVSSSHMNTDHVACVVIASGIAAVGLVTDGTVDILASFFVSPLMTMVLGSCWGSCVGDGNLVLRSMRNLFIDAFVTIFVGVVMAIVLGVFFPHDPDGVSAEIHFGHYGTWNAVSVSTMEIMNRGPPPSNVCFASVVAAFSGIAVALGHTGGLPSALAGVALSTSLLPPLVNVGLMLGLAAFYPTVRTSRGDRLITVAAYSAMIYAVNVVAVFIFAFATLKFKRIGGRSLRAAKRDFAASSTFAWQRVSDPANEATVDETPTKDDLSTPLIGPNVVVSDDNDDAFRADHRDHRLASLAESVKKSFISPSSRTSAASAVSFPGSSHKKTRDFVDLDDVRSLDSDDQPDDYHAFSEQDTENNP